MAIASRTNHFISPLVFSRIQTLIFDFHRLNHTLSREDSESPHLRKEHALLREDSESSHSRKEPSCDVVVDRTSRFCSLIKAGFFEPSRWKVLYWRRDFWVDNNKISYSARTVLEMLRRNGFQAYLVGGCVRDLLLDRIPKDFDVITDANLNEIKKQFKRSWIVGQEFPICLVCVKGSTIEVSSFDTVARHSLGKEEVSFTQMPTDCDEKDFVRWRNCLKRDFTINSLFYDPSVKKIYDYTNGIEDLKLCKVQTVIPAQLSFKEDCARILRGIRVAARLGLSFSQETATAINELYTSIEDLNKSRLMREVSFMFSYGAAAPSLFMLKRFRILDILLPLHAAYLAQQLDNQTAKNPVMLLEMFCSMDNLFSCDQPSQNELWVALLAFHLALVDNPQDALVIWAFSSVLYYGDWDKAVYFARKSAQKPVQFSPEILEACPTKSNEELAKEVADFTLLVISSADSMIEQESLIQSMARHTNRPCGLVFISEKIGKYATKPFHDLRKKLTNYELLKKRDSDKTTFILGRVILDTLSRGVQQQMQEVPKEKGCQPELGLKGYQEMDTSFHKHQHQHQHQHQQAEKENCHHSASNAEQKHRVNEKLRKRSNPVKQREINNKDHKPCQQVSEEKHQLPGSRLKQQLKGENKCKPLSSFFM